MSVILACSVLDRLRGLFGRRDFTGTLVLFPCNDVHTYGMRRPIDVAFVTAEGLVAESYRDVGPKRRLRCREADFTLERFAREGPWFQAGNQVDIRKLVERGLHENETGERRGH